jgi:hypothetical protein
MVIDYGSERDFLTSDRGNVSLVNKRIYCIITGIHCSEMGTIGVVLEAMYC